MSGDESQTASGSRKDEGTNRQLSSPPGPHDASPALLFLHKDAPGRMEGIPRDEPDTVRPGSISTKRQNTGAKWVPHFVRQAEISTSPQVYIYVYVCECVCAYICIYAYIHTYMYIYTHTYINKP